MLVRRGADLIAPAPAGGSYADPVAVVDACAEMSPEPVDGAPPGLRPLVSRPVLAPVVAGAVGLGACVAMAVVDPTGGPVLCLFRAATGLACPFCGSTRMLHRLAVGDPIGAFRYNPVVLLAVPLVAWWLFASLTAALGGPRWRTPRLPARAGWTLLGVLALWWVARNLPIAPFDTLPV